MAQALFDEHPLEEYLRESGESSMLIPGISSELEQEIDLNYGLFDDATPDESQLDWCPHIFAEFLQMVEAMASLAKSQTPTSSFIERFKYNVISSSLLELCLPAPHPQRTHRPLRIPGNLQHSRASSMELDHPPALSTPSPEHSYGSISVAALLAALFFSVGCHFFAFLSMVAAAFILYTVIYMTETPKYDMSLSLNALDDLVAANDTWDSVVQDAMIFLDNEDHNIHNSTGQHSPSPIRVALHSCLQTTHTQCDNIRHLFSALTSPTNLSQLSEMYAPPSPVTTTAFSPEVSSRPLSIHSLPITSRSISTPTTPQNKRSTWTGSYSSLAYAGSPTASLFRRRERRKTIIADVFQNGTSSAPTSPFVNTSPSAPQDVRDESMLTASDEDQLSPIPAHFGAAALDLQRNRKSSGIEAFRMPPDNYFASDLRSPRNARNSMFASSSKFTKPQPSRHPLSHSALNHSLQSTLAAKRHACSHLLALRFGDEEDDGYWEDVRSVMGLLSSTLMDGYSRLAEALTEMEHQKLRDQNPTPVSSEFHSSEIDAVEPKENDTADPLSAATWPKSANRVSFAPMPNNVNRFAAHVAAISSALDDARDHLEECVSALKANPASSTNPSPSKGSRHSRSLSGMLSPAAQETEEPHALQAYERLRRELGLALRECERGRGRLLDIINPPVIPSDDEEEFDDLPGLGHDASDDSDKADPASPYDDEAEAAALAASRPYRSSAGHTEAGDGPLMDDATPHLLLATSTQHLPLPGIEEVFEADTGAKAAFRREKSKLSREDRIKIAKARRESGTGLSIGSGVGNDDDTTGKVGVEKWGPGGEVVQELKDVIWKVGERRRMMTVVNATTPAPAELPTDLLPSEATQLAPFESS